VFPLRAQAEEVRLRGDCSGDGVVNAADAALVLRSLVRLDKLAGADYIAADANSDGRVDAQDAAFILRSLVRLETLSGYVSIPPMITNLRFVNPPTVTVLQLGEQLTLIAAYDLNGAAAPHLVFASSDPNVLQVIYAGNSCTVTAVGPGTAAVAVTDPLSGYEARASFTVSRPRDEALYQLVLGNLRVGSPSDWIEPVFAHIEGLNADNSYHKVLLEGMKLLGTPYGRNSGQLDCSMFTNAAYKNAGVTSVRSGSSDNQMKGYEKDGKLNLLPEPVGGQFNLSMLSPGHLLFWVDGSGNANHLAFYLGRIYGVDFLLESASGAGGVAIRPNWGNNVKGFTLKYWVAPLG